MTSERLWLYFKSQSAMQHKLNCITLTFVTNDVWIEFMGPPHWNVVNFIEPSYRTGQILVHSWKKDVSRSIYSYLYNKRDAHLLFSKKNPFYPLFFMYLFNNLFYLLFFMYENILPTTDYGHTKAKSQILCGPNSNPTPK